MTYKVKTVTQLCARSKMYKCTVFMLNQSFTGRSLGLWSSIFDIFDPGAVHGAERRLRITPSVRGVYISDSVFSVFLTRP